MATSYTPDMDVEVRYPVTPGQARDAWPWLSGVIEEQCGPDEWAVCVTAPEAAVLRSAVPAPEGTPDDELYCPVVFRDASEIRAVAR